MVIKHYMTGPLRVNTYLVYDEETKKGFIVDPGGYDPYISVEVKNNNEIVNSIRGKLYNFPDNTKVLPGHMGATTIGEEKAGNPFV